jgi:predicted RNA-binding Zn-ribbon protein involved in translation (DUF1610 family)
MSFDDLWERQKTKMNCVGCGQYLGVVLHNYAEDKQIMQIRQANNWRCPRCGKELSTKPIKVPFPNLFFHYRGFVWRLKHAF